MNIAKRKTVIPAIIVLCITIVVTIYNYLIYSSYKEMELFKDASISLLGSYSPDGKYYVSLWAEVSNDDDDEFYISAVLRERGFVYDEAYSNYKGTGYYKDIIYKDIYLDKVCGEVPIDPYQYNTDHNIDLDIYWTDNTHFVINGKKISVNGMKYNYKTDISRWFK